MSTFSSLLSTLRPQHRHLLALTIKNGLWGDCDYEFATSSHECETCHALGYITNDIVKGYGRKISAMYKAIYSYLCDSNGIGEFLSHANDWWGDGSGDVLFIRYDQESEWTEWADNELTLMSEEEFLSTLSTRGGRREGAGRKKVEGKRHMWTIPNDIDQVAKEKGKDYIWKAVRNQLALDSIAEKLKDTYERLNKKNQ